MYDFRTSSRMSRDISPRSCSSIGIYRYYRCTDRSKSVGLLRESVQRDYHSGVIVYLGPGGITTELIDIAVAFIPYLGSVSR